MRMKNSALKRFAPLFRGKRFPLSEYQSLTLSILLLGLMVVSDFAQSVPELVNYQGRVVDSNNASLETGEYALSVSIYTNENSGAAAWGPQEWGEASNGVGRSMESVPVVRGYFSVVLGPQDVNSVSLNQAFNQEDAWIEVVCDGVTNARQRILSVPYAMTAGNGTPVGGIIMWSGEVSMIPEGWALCDGNEELGTPDLRDRFIVGAGNAYDVGADGGANSVVLDAPQVPLRRHSHTYTDRYDTDDNPSSDPTWAGSNDLEMYGDGDGVIRRVRTEFTGNTLIENNIAAHENRPPYYALAFIMRIE